MGIIKGLRIDKDLIEITWISQIGNWAPDNNLMFLFYLDFSSPSYVFLKYSFPISLQNKLESREIFKKKLKVK